MANELLTIPEAAKRYRLAADTLYRWATSGLISCVRVGPVDEDGRRRYVRVRESDLADKITAEHQREAT